MAPEISHSRVIELESCKIYKRTDGIIVFDIKPDLTLNLSDVKSHLDAFLEIRKGERTPLLVFADHLNSLGYEEKAFMNANVAKFATKLGILTNNPLPTFIYRIAFYLTPPPIPSQVFKSEKEAVEWLKK